MKRVACCFTGGKDSCLALHLLKAAGGDAGLGEEFEQQRLSADVCLLVLFAPAGGPEFKAHPIECIRLQAEAVGLPLEVVEISSEPTYLDGYRAAITALKERHGIDALATGDILDVCSDFMSRATTGIVELWRPLWGLPRPQLLSLLWRHSISPLISCVHLPKFTPGASQPEPHHCLVQSDTDGAACHGSAATTGGVSADSAALTGQQACHGNAAAAQDARPGLNPVQDVLGHVLSAEFHAKVLQGACQELGIDECGEHGEFHTQVISAPLFQGRRLQLSTERCVEGEFAFLKVLSVQLVEDSSTM